MGKTFKDLKGLKIQFGILGCDTILGMQTVTRMNLIFALLISGILSTFPAKADSYVPAQYTLTFDAVGQGLYFPPFYKNAQNPSIGGGGQFFADFRPYQEVSFGVGLEYLYFSLDKSFSLSSVDIGGRIYPFEYSNMGEFYLQGGVGYNMIRSATWFDPGILGHYHGNAGVGYRFAINKSTALDLGIQYDYYSPQAISSNGVRLRVGLTFGFGEVMEKLIHGGMKDRVVFIPQWKLTPTYTWKENDSLRDVAAQLYGDEDFYPLLVDANPSLLNSNVQFRVGMKLKVPAPPLYDHDADVLRSKANEEKQYVHLDNLSEAEGYGWGENWDGPETYTWKKGDTLPKVADKLYGDEDLYPLLVDAIKDRLIHPANLLAGVVITVPKPEIDKIDEIHLKVWFEKDPYIWWKTVSERQAKQQEGKKPYPSQKFSLPQE